MEDSESLGGEVRSGGGVGVMRLILYFAIWAGDASANERASLMVCGQGDGRGAEN